MRRLIWLNLLLVALLAGCRLPSLLPQVGAGGAGVERYASGSVLKGKLGESRRVQVNDLTTEFAPGATVSLIDSVTGHTAATTVTDANGEFVMRFDDGFAPVPDRPYYLDAIKGIKGRGPDETPNEQFNQAGADALRLRTIIYHQASPAGWVSFYNWAPAPITISRESTTLAIAIYLKNQTLPLDLRAFIGSLDPLTNAYSPVAGISADEFSAAFAIVDGAITQDRDPVQYIAYDSAAPNGFVNLFNSHSIGSLAPTSGAIGKEIAILGDGFNYPGTMTVRFAGIGNSTVDIAEGNLVERSKNRIRVKVPVGARTGPVSVQIGTVTQAGPTFSVESFDGHRAMFNGVLYVANFDRAEVVAVHPDGTVRSFATVPAGPTQVVVGPDNLLYVACQTANKVVTLNPASTPALASDFVSMTAPSGMAFLGNVLYVASSTGDKISRFELNKTSAGPDLTGFSAPSALAFDYASNLYVAEEGRVADNTVGKVVRVNLTTNQRNDLIYPSRPTGLSIDPGGTLYVASYDDDLILRVLPNDLKVSVFARVPAPAGITLDENGFMFAASNSQQQIYRISPLGDLKPYAYGISNPRGLAVGNDGALYVALSQSNAILKVVDKGGAGYETTTFLKGIANPHSITWHDDRLYIAHRDTGVISSADVHGNVRTEAVGLTRPGGVDLGSDGTLYAGSYGASGHGETVLSQPFHMYLDKGGIEMVGADKLVREKPRLVRPGSLGIVGLDDGTRFFLTSQYRSLVMSERIAGSSFRNRTLRVFTALPRHIERDATGATLFVTLQGDNKIYRFKRSGETWTESTITSPAFVAPTDMTYDAPNDRLYVLDGTTIRRITSAAATPVVDTWSTTAAGVTDIGYGNTRLYLAYGTKTIDELDPATKAVTPRLTDAPSDLTHVMVNAANGELVVRRGGGGFYVVNAANVFYAEGSHSPGASAFALTPNGTRVYSIDTYAYSYGPVFLSSLLQSHEVAVDRDAVGGDRVYVASFMNDGGQFAAIHRYDPKDDTEMVIRGFGNQGVGTLALNAQTRKVYAGTTSGQLYEVNPDGTVAHWATLTGAGILYGLDITRNNGTLWAVDSSRYLYSITLGGKTQAQVKAGLSAPRF